jgi:hypothetical protein
MLKAETSILLFWLVTLTLLCFGCGVPQSKIDGALASGARQSKPEPTPAPLWLTDPTCCKFGTPAPDELKEAWGRFARDGRYRLARPEDMKFGGGERVRTLFDFPWGDLGYDQMPGAGHLAAIVVDTTRADDSRFGLIIFSAPKSRKGAYAAHWLYRERDLSRAGVTRASGELYVSEYRGDGSEAVCRVRWDERQTRYVCD